VADEPLADPAWRAHLFRTRTEEQIGAWARSLRWFRFCRGRTSGFLTEPDRLVVALEWRDEGDRAVLLELLGLAGGVDGWQDLAGVRVRVEGGPRRLLLSVSGAEQRRPEIIDRDVEAASQVETALVSLDGMADRIVDPPIDDRSCVAPGRYPALFDEPD
jgi:hypothetical protein